MIDYSNLNDEQRDAVFDNHNRILCLAGAGTGKTRVLTSRAARLWESGISSSNMLCLTFTRAAGAEMKERVIALIGGDGKKLFCNTFHAFCVELIRRYLDKLGYDEGFSVYGQREADELAAKIIAELKLSINRKKFLNARAGKLEWTTAAERKHADRAIKEYEYRLRRNNAFDFESLIQTAKRALTDGEIRKELCAQYKYVFVDEFQDTDPAQADILRLLNPENLFIVGDDFQSIYGFRGAKVEIIMELASDPEWKVVKLEQNYRSTIPIVAAANRLIERNNQTEKKLVTDKPGVEIDFRKPMDDAVEVDEIVSRIWESLNDGNRGTTAVIARTNKQLERVKSILKNRGVQYEMLAAAESPLTSAAANLLFAWMAAIVNPLDDAAASQIAEKKMSKAAFLEIEHNLLSGADSFMKTLTTTKPGRAFLELYQQIKEGFIASHDTLAGASWLYSNLGAGDVRVLLEIQQWQERQAKVDEPATTEALLEFVRICNVADKPAMEIKNDKVYLMTVHGSKGLEFDDVYVIGAAQGVFPNKGDILEERRLFYVAMTRAKTYLNISSPRFMTDWLGYPYETKPSQFIDEALNKMDREVGMIWPG
jgi:DNA helicase-2/ATP-dependent DNA helicase PcrA